MGVSSPPVELFPPIDIRDEGDDSDLGEGGHFYGPFENGADLYIVGLKQTSGVPLITVVKSSDGGNTWAEQDPANEPPENTNGFDVVQSGTVLTLYFKQRIPSTTSVQLITFDMATDTYGAASPQGPANPASTILATFPNLRMARVSSGDIFGFYGRNNAGNLEHDIVYSKFSGGAWGAEVSFAANGFDTTTVARAAVVDQNDLIHLIAAYGNAFTNNTLITHQTLTPGEVIGVADTIDTIVGVHNPVLIQRVGRSVIWQNQFVAVPFYDQVNGRAGVYLSNQLASPTVTPWPFTIVDSNTFAAFTDRDVTLTVDTSGNLILFWNTFDDSDLANIINRTYYAVNDGTGWGLPQLLYDEIVNPPTGNPIPPDDQFLHTLSAVKLAAGNFGVQTAINNGNCAGYYLLDAACDIVLTPAPQGTGEPIRLPAATGGVDYRGLINANDAGGPPPPQDFDFTITTGNLPPQMFLISPGGPGNTTHGATVYGKPSHTDWTGPTLYQFGLNVRLVQ